MVISHSPFYPRRPCVQRRRDATSVMAGRFDPIPERDVLTSCLNHISPYYEVEKAEEEKHKKKLERKQKDKERKRKAREDPRVVDKHYFGEPVPHPSTSSSAAGPSTQPQQAATPSSSRCYIRPTIHIPAVHRSLSITPSPPSSPQFVGFTPGSTPGPSMSSSTSRTSSKRPRTPDDDDDDDDVFALDSSAPPESRPRKKRVASKKGWKGWVEGSPQPSSKLINLDAVPVLQERRTRSGKSFDAIGVGKDSWV